MRSLKQETEESFLELGWPLAEKEKEEQNDFFFNRSNLVLPDFITKRLISQRFVNWCASYFSHHPNVFIFLNSIRQPLMYTLFSNIMLRFVIKKHSKWDLLIGAIRLNKAVFSQLSNELPVVKCIIFMGTQAYLSMGVIHSCFKAVKNYNRRFLKRERLLIGAQKTVEVCRKLDQLLSKHPEFSKHLLLRDTLQTKPQGSDHSSRLVLNQLNNNRITSPSFLNYWLWGDRIIVNKCIVENSGVVRNHILPTLAGLGEVDAYCALSTQFKQYSVPQFVDNGTQISLHQFFHPNMNNPVCNDLDLSLTGKKRICVSGGNGSGKSAITRSILGSIVAAQTFKRTPASNATISQFDKIAIFANLSDNLVASKFQVELGKLKKLQEYLEKNPDKKVLLMLDEPLTSINTELVGKILRDLFLLFNKYQNLVIFCVSNTPELKDFKDAVHMGTIVDTNPDGTFKPTYRWKEGSAYVSDVWFQFRKIFGEDFGTSGQVVRN